MVIGMHFSQSGMRLLQSVASSFAFWWLMALAIEWVWPTAIARHFSPHWFAFVWVGAIGVWWVGSMTTDVPDL